MSEQKSWSSADLSQPRRTLRVASQEEPTAEEADPMGQHVIVSGDDALATTIIEELERAGASVARLLAPELARTRIKAELDQAGIAEAVAVVCAGDDDATNLEIALLARRANPDIRVVGRLANEVLREAVAVDEGPSAIFGVADLAAPAIVE